MTKQEDAEKLCQQFLHLLGAYNQMEKRTHTYGGEVPLHLSEVHTIAAIGAHPGQNIVALAKAQGVSRSAASQMVSKLVQKHLVQKKNSPETDNEVILQLTAAGLSVYKRHQAQHQWFNARLTEILAAYPPELLLALGQVADEVEKLWQEPTLLD